MSDDLITLRIDGVDWTYWTSVSIVRRMDAIASAFTITLADKWEGGAQPGAAVQALPIAIGMECEVLIGADPVVKGYINKVTPRFTATEHSISISGRDKSADLVDCSAVHKPGHWKGLDALQLAAVLAEPFGVSVTAAGDMGAPFPSFKLEQGETAFEALERVLQQRELLASPDGAGGLVLLKTGERVATTALVQGGNILTASADFDEADRFSHYLVEGQQPGTDDVYGLDACAVHAENRDMAITRYRPLIIRAESQVNAASAKQRAAWESSVRAARSVSVPVSVQGFRMDDGALWQENMLVDADIPYLRIKQQLLISQVTFRRDKSGSITTLELKDPNVFQPEPKKQSGQSATTSVPDAPIEGERDLTASAFDAAKGEHRKIKDGAV